MQLPRVKEAGMRRHLTAILATGVLIAGGGVAFAEHSSWAQYDVNKPAIVEGTVTTIDWVQPRAFLTIEGTGTNGRWKEFRVELGSPRSLERKGWTRDSIKEGESVRVRGWYARNDYSRIRARSLKLHDRELNVGLTFSQATATTRVP